MDPGVHLIAERLARRLQLGERSVGLAQVRLGRDQVGEAVQHRLDRGAVLLGDRAAVARQLEVGEHPPGRVELRPRGRGAVGHRQPQALCRLSLVN